MYARDCHSRPARPRGRPALRLRSQEFHVDMLRWTAGAWFAGALLVLGVHGQDEVPFAPKTRYDPAHSFRGLAENNLTIANYEVSGHASVLSHLVIVLLLTH